MMFSSARTTEANARASPACGVADRLSTSQFIRASGYLVGEGATVFNLESSASVIAKNIEGGELQAERMVQIFGSGESQALARKRFPSTKEFLVER